MNIYVVTPFEETEWQWFGKDFAGMNWRIRNLSLFGRKPWFWLIAAIRAAKQHENAEIVISHHPYMCFYLSLAYMILRKKVDHYCFSFNHGNGRFFRGVMKLLAAYSFRTVSGFVVFSEQEKKIYGSYYGIPLNKFGFVHWAVQAPVVDAKILSKLNLRSPYVCCMGRNNRDFGTFIAALRKLSINGIIVCKVGQLDGIDIPKNVSVLYDIPMIDAMTILSGALVSVTLLKDESTGAGHITVVSAMQLGIPQILTRLLTVSDYFTDGDHGVFVNKGDVDSLIEAIRMMIQSPELREQMAVNAKRFAENWLSEDASKRHLTAYLKKLASGEMPPHAPVGWAPLHSHPRMKESVAL